ERQINVGAETVRRRDFLGHFGAVTFVAIASRPAWSQTAPRNWRVALLTGGPANADAVSALREGLASRGYVEGQTITLDIFAPPTAGDVSSFAVKAVASHPDVIVAGGGVAAPAAKEATSSIPIVFTAVSDPIGIGLVSNLAHPGG